MRYGVALLAAVVVLFSCASKSDSPAQRESPAFGALTAGKTGGARQAPGTPAVKPAKPARRAEPAFAYKLLKHDTPQEMRAESVTVVSMRVRNASNRAWLAKGPIKLGYYWLDAQGTRIPRSQGRAFVRKDTPPDSTVGIRCRVKAPPVMGEHTLVYDMLDDKTWFGSKGASRTRVSVKVK